MGGLGPFLFAILFACESMMRFREAPEGELLGPRVASSDGFRPFTVWECAFRSRPFLLNQCRGMFDGLRVPVSIGGDGGSVDFYDLHRVGTGSRRRPRVV